MLVIDQPLFAIAKVIQWNFTATHGEDKYLIMAGGLHTEMKAFKVIGNWLDESGWTTAIFNAGIATSGVPLLEFYKFIFQCRTTVTPDNTTEIKMR